MSTPKMQQLIAQAQTALDTTITPEAEVARQMQICNACRYCEGFCAVFPAMTRRLDFSADDAHYLANLCHNCGACLHACQYAPPHEFAVNVPQAMAQVRVKTYAHYAWPQSFAKAYAHNGLTLSLALAAGLALFFVLAAAWHGGLASLFHTPNLQANFYAVFPHNTLAALFGAVFGFALFSMTIGAWRFWQAQRPVIAASAGTTNTSKAVGNTSARASIAPAAALEATHDVLRLKYLDGGHGEGCHNADTRWTQARRVFHHFTFYGFMLCFASTSVATLYHYVLNQPAPYAYTSLPVVLGTLGGLGLLVGPVGLFALKLRRHPSHGDSTQNPMDYGFIALLFFTSLTGLALLVWRSSAAMPALLCVHLGVVLALFATLPFGKMAHGVYRSAALLKYAVERRLPSNLKLASD